MHLSAPSSFCFKPYFGEVLKKATWPPSPRVRPIRNWSWKVSWLKWSNHMSIEVSSFKIYVLKSFGFNITHLSSSPCSFYFKPYVGELLKKATWPLSPRVRPTRNWMWKVSWLKWWMKLYQASSFKIYFLESFGSNITHLSSSMTQSISQSKVSCFKITVLRVSLLQLVIIIIVSILNPILGRSSRKPPDPPPHAYDQ